MSDPANEIREGIAHIISLVEDLKLEKELAAPSNSCQFSQPDHKVAHRRSPRSNTTENRIGDQWQGSGASSVQGVHDPNIDTYVVFSATSPEVILRWPVFNNVIHEEDTHIQSFILDFIDKQTELQARMQAEMQAKMPRNFQLKQANTGQNLGDLSYLCERYLVLVHHSLPLVDVEEIRRFALEVAMHGLGWDSKTCLVVRFLNLQVMGYTRIYYLNNDATYSRGPNSNAIIQLTLILALGMCPGLYCLYFPSRPQRPPRCGQYAGASTNHCRYGIGRYLFRRR